MGLPGSGKSHLAEALAKGLNGVWINADKVREDQDETDPAAASSSSPQDRTASNSSAQPRGLGRNETTVLKAAEGQNRGRSGMV